MVSKVNQQGIRDWLAQRVTAVLTLAYFIVVLWRLMHAQLNTQAQWQLFFSSVAVRIASIMVLGAMLWHAWIGIWTVLTDYVKPTGLRILLQVIVLMLLVATAIWATLILFSVPV